MCLFRIQYKYSVGAAALWRALTLDKAKCKCSARFSLRTDPMIRYIVYPLVIVLPLLQCQDLSVTLKRALRISRSIAQNGTRQIRTRGYHGLYGSHSRRFHLLNHPHRLHSPTPMSQPSALVATAIGAIVMTAVDKYVIEDTSKNDRSSLHNDYGT
jgi:hypothetical protein